MQPKDALPPELCRRLVCGTCPPAPELLPDPLQDEQLVVAEQVDLAALETEIEGLDRLRTANAEIAKVPYAPDAKSVDLGEHALKSHKVRVGVGDHRDCVSDAHERPAPAACRTEFRPAQKEFTSAL